MKRVGILSILLLFWVFSEIALSGNVESKPPVRTAVSFFKNATGDISLDWVSWGLQDAITADLQYLSGFEEYSSYLLWSSMDNFQDQEKFKQEAKRKDFLNLQHGWVGEYRKEGGIFIIDVSVVDIASG